jgi:hypothetical protein
MKKRSVRLYVPAALAAMLLLAIAAPARAQYKPRPLNDPATGETFHVEFGAGFWNPTSDIVVSSGGSGALSGLAGTQIDAKRDLGFSDQRFPSLKLVLRPAEGHKFRLDYTPMSFAGSSTIQQDIVFNGQRYRLGLPLNSTLDWKAYRFGYEYDFVRKNRGFGGFILEAKYTDVRVELDTVGVQEFAQARGPIPALGGIARYYVVPNISITGEVTGFKLPTIQDRYSGHYVDVDVYGTVNFTNNIGVQGGYRSLDMGYLVKQDTGSFVLKGIYFGVVARY